MRSSSKFQRSVMDLEGGGREGEERNVRCLFFTSVADMKG